MSLYQLQLHRPYGVVIDAAETRHHYTALETMNKFLARCRGRTDGFVIVMRDGQERTYAQMRGDDYQGPRGIDRSPRRFYTRLSKAQLEQARG